MVKTGRERGRRVGRKRREGEKGRVEMGPRKTPTVTASNHLGEWKASCLIIYGNTP